MHAWILTHCGKNKHSLLLSLFVFLQRVSLYHLSVQDKTLASALNDLFKHQTAFSDRTAGVCAGVVMTSLEVIILIKDVPNIARHSRQ